MDVGQHHLVSAKRSGTSVRSRFEHERVGVGGQRIGSQLGVIVGRASEAPARSHNLRGRVSRLGAGRRGPIESNMATITSHRPWETTSSPPHQQTLPSITTLTRDVDSRAAERTPTSSAPKMITRDSAGSWTGTAGVCKS